MVTSLDRDSRTTAWAFVGSLLYTITLLGMPLLVLWFKAMVRGWDTEMAHLPLWRVPVRMPSAYTMFYLLLVAGAVYFVPLAAQRSRMLLLVVLAALLVSAVGMIPVFFVPAFPGQP